MTINIQYIKQNLTGGLPERLALVHVPNIYIYICWAPGCWRGTSCAIEIAKPAIGPVLPFGTCV